MGETRGCRPPERPTYPGLVRPYRDDSDYVNQPKFLVNKMSKSTRPDCLEHDPFSIYDDDSAHDHYFFLPAGKLDLNSFKRTSTTLHPNSRSNPCASWSRNKPNSERESMRKAISQTTSHCQCKVQTTQTHTTRQQPSKQNNNFSDSCKRSLITSKTKRPSSGEYCSLSVDAVIPKYPGITRSHQTPIDEESFRKFALKLVRSNSNNSTSDINQNDYHNPSRRKNDSNELCSGDKSSKSNYNLSKCIDRCTCMICLKAGNYHCSGDTDSYVEEPCSCIGSSRKTVVGRWFCMGFVALFLPCLVCYLPAKLCQSSCMASNCSSKTKLSSSSKLKRKQCLVKYVKEEAHEIDENRLL